MASVIELQHEERAGGYYFSGARAMSVCGWPRIRSRNSGVSGGPRFQITCTVGHPAHRGNHG
eukprot:4182328-Pyramimonas_sp.AAC.1